MAIFAIGDLHLSFSTNKPMNIFGDNWNNHEEKIKKSWLENVKEEDLVIILGDFSWAMQLEDAYSDFLFINELPGKKLLLKGNHDYWWNTVTSMKKFLQEKEIKNVEFLQNNSYEFENVVIAGTRGWNFNDEKILNRELLRLELSLKEASKATDKEIIVCMHYPPTTSNLLKQNMQFIELMKKYNVKKCFYGHLHAESIQEKIEGLIEGIEFKLLSADAINFQLFKIN